MNQLISYRTRFFISTIATALCGFLMAQGALAATASFTAATGGSAISADTVASNTYTALTGPVITESASGQIGMSGSVPGTVNLAAPTGFQFNTASPVTVTVTELDANNAAVDNINQLASGASFSATVTSSLISIPIMEATTSGNFDSLTWYGIQVKPKNTTTPFASGNITKAGSTGISGVDATKNLGTLTEVSGVIASATISASKTQISPFSTSTLTMTNIDDQFGNAITNGTIVGLQTSLGTLSNCTTVSSGSATCTLASTVTGTAVLTIPNTTITGVASVTVVPGPTTQLVMSASPTSLTFNQTSRITISGKDFYGNVTTSDNTTTVVLSADNGGSLDKNILTFANGTASAVLSKSSTGVVNIGASSGSLAPVSAKITFVQADTVAPFVESVSPANGATGVDPSATTYSITFSKALNTNTVSSSNIQLMEEGQNGSPDAAVAAIVSPAEGDAEVLIQPTLPLSFSQTYYFAVSAAVTDQVGNALTPVLDSSTESNYSFSTEDDPTVLGVTGVTLTKSSASADNSFDDGWQWVMNVTVPANQSQLAVNFDDWTNTDLVDTIPAADNVEFYSPQSTDASTADTAMVATTSLETLNTQRISQQRLGGNIQQPADSIDLTPSTSDRQVQLYINVKVPNDAVPGSYFTQYDLESQ